MLTAEQIQEMNEIKWAHRIDMGGGIETPGYYQHTAALATPYFGMPANLTGKTVLDIGCSDGMFSFEAERRGAIVTAIDSSKHDALCIGKAEDWPRGFQFAKRVLKSKVGFFDMDLYDLPALCGLWDIVLFLGVLYHLPDPIGALRALAGRHRGIRPDRNHLQPGGRGQADMGISARAP